MPFIRTLPRCRRDGSLLRDPIGGWVRIGRVRLAKLVLIAACSGCGMGPLDPAATGGVPLAGTRGTAAQGGTPFSISSDGRWLSFALDAALPGNINDDPAALERYELDRLEKYRLLSLDGKGMVQPMVSPEAEEVVRAGGYPLPGAGCWVGPRLVIRTALNRSLFIDTNDTPATWRPGPRNAKVQNCPFPDRRPLSSGNYGPTRLLVGDDGQITLSDRDSGRELAVHEPGWLPGMSIQVPYLEVSRGGRLAYGVLDHFGSFVGNTTAFLLDPAVRAGTRALGSPVQFVQWAPDGGALYGYGGVVETGATVYAIYRWTTAR